MLGFSGGIHSWLENLKPALTPRSHPVTRQVRTADGAVEIWSAADALVLKATALVLHKELAPMLSPRCFHLAGHGGLKGAVRAVDAARRDQMFVFRTDVHGYYVLVAGCAAMWACGFVCLPQRGSSVVASPQVCVADARCPLPAPSGRRDALLKIDALSGGAWWPVEEYNDEPV